MTHLIRSLAVATAASAMLAACSSAPADSENENEWMQDARLGEKVDRICFRSNIDSFRQNTRNTVIVEKGVNDEYLLQTMGNCYDLDHAQSLSFDTSMGSSCLTKGDSIYAFDSVFGPDRTDPPSIRCPIAAIYEWNEDAAEDEEADASED
ncbi:DUF6491 family protein [Henriciella aquimarina]|uniref:DUF6491 family protein n=1 Tax=Henriciella aquimarina TaxID=545261 RepID=UPI000A0785F0|nr:DUF6491 family protein [Henriciella aquimarina]